MWLLDQEKPALPSPANPSEASVRAAKVSQREVSSAAAAREASKLNLQQPTLLEAFPRRQSGLAFVHALADSTHREGMAVEGKRGCHRSGTGSLSVD